MGESTVTTDSSPEWSARTKRTVILIALAFILILSWRIRSIFPLVIVSALIAYILNPMVTFLARRVFIARDGHGRRGPAALVAFLIIIILLTIILVVVVPEIIDQVAEFGSSIPGWVQSFEDDLTAFLEQPIIINNAPLELDGEVLIPLDRIEEATGTRDLTQLLLLDDLDLGRAVTQFFNSARDLSGPAFSFLGGAFNTVISIIFLLMMMFYLLKDGHVFVDTVIDLVPEAYQADMHRLTHDIAGVWNAYLRGQLILSLVIGVAVYIAAAVLGLPNAIILGLIAGLLEFIPNLGPLLALIPAAFLALVTPSATISGLSGIPFMLVVIVVWMVIQNVEAVFLVPRIMGDNLDLHPFAVIVAVLSGAAISGALGVILAAPFVATGRVLVQYVYGKLTGRSPFRVARAEEERELPTPIAKLVVRFWRFCTSFLGRRWTRRKQQDIARE